MQNTTIDRNGRIKTANTEYLSILVSGKGAGKVLDF
jgi:hypothetical protein